MCPKVPSGLVGANGSLVSGRRLSPDEKQEFLGEVYPLGDGLAAGTDVELASRQQLSRHEGPIGEGMILGEEQAECFQPHQATHQNAIVEGTPASLRSPEDHVDLSTEEASQGDGNPAAESAQEFDARARPASLLDQEIGGESLSQCVNQQGAGGAAGLCHHSIVEGQELTCRRNEPSTCRRQRHLPARAVEQLDSEVLLQPIDMPTNRLLGEEETGRGPGEVKLLRDRHEGTKEFRIEVERHVTHALSIHTANVLILLETMLDGLCPEPQNAGGYRKTRPAREHPGGP